MSEFWDCDVPKLGFGLTRIPMYGKSTTRADVLQVKYMVDRFLEAGFRYFDTSYDCRDGLSEKAIKEALVSRYPRESFFLASRLPAWMASSREEAEQMFFDSLERTGVGYFDCLLLSELGWGRTEAFERFDMWSFLSSRKVEGTIRHLGFSFRGSAQELERILTAHPEAELVQLSINYADWNSGDVQSRACYEAARRHNKPIIISAPVKGGHLADPPYEAADALRDANPTCSLASWALRFAASMEGVCNVIVSAGSIPQMNDNIDTMRSLRPLNSAEKAALAKAQAVFDALPTVPCIGCGKCEIECPEHVGIAAALAAANEYSIYDHLKLTLNDYHTALNRAGLNDFASCTGCGRCESVCPAKINIAEELKKAAELLS